MESEVVMEMRGFPVRAVLSLVRAQGLGAMWSEVHELAEWVAGHSIWIHELAEKALWDRLRDLLCAQHEWLADLDEFPRDGTREQADAYVARYAAAHGTEVGVVRDRGERAESPLESMRRIAPDVPAIAVVVAGSLRRAGEVDDK